MIKAFIISSYSHVIWSAFLYLFPKEYKIGCLYVFDYIIIAIFMYFVIKKILGLGRNTKFIILYILACLVVFAFTFIMFYLITFWHLFFLISYYPIVLIINILFLYLTGFDINYKKIALSFLLVLFIMLYSLFFVIVLCINSGTNDILFSTRLIFMKPTLLIKNGVIIAGLVFFEIMILKIFKSKWKTVK